MIDEQPTIIQEPALQPIDKSSNHKPVVVGLVLLLLLTASIAGYFYYQNQQLRQQTELVEQDSFVAEISPQPSFTELFTDGWEIYIGETFSFKYPAELILEQNELITLRTETSPEMADPLLLIDARFMFPHESLGQALDNTDNNLDVISRTEIPSGVRISGKIKEGSYRANTPVLIAYVQRDEGVVSVESTGDQIDPLLFDQILSTLEFVD